MKPIIKWVGGKTQLLDVLETKIDLENRDYSNMTYVEPFVGAGALFLDLAEKDIFNKYIINDINPRLINVYNTIKNDVDGLIIELKTLKDSYLSMNEDDRKTMYYNKRTRFNSIEIESYNIESAALFIFLNKTCFNGLYRENKNGEFNTPYNRSKSPSFFVESELRKLNNILNTKNVQIFNNSYSELEPIIINDNCFVYLDPPYRPITKGGFNGYNKSGFNDNDQIILRDFCDRLNDNQQMFMLSNSDPHMLDPDDNFFDDLYSNYTIDRVQASRKVNSDKNNRGCINEILVYNF